MSIKQDLNRSDIISWKLIGFIILSIRFVQGFIFWGGGSRRFIYDPAKLDPHSTQWMANKLQSAMPGALLGIGHVIDFLLQHFVLLYTAIILFSLAELLCGLALMLGLFTRLAGLITALMSISLMIIFGWEGSTCVDEWTMSVANLSMGLTLALSGGFVYSIDSFLLRRYPSLLNKKWFVSTASGPLSYNAVRITSIIFALFAIFFTLSTYNYYRGAILSRYHTGPVSAVVHHLALTEGFVKKDGEVSFNIYVDAGTPALPSNIIRIELADSKGKLWEVWSGQQLSQLSMSNITNRYAYNRIMTGPYGLVAPVSAKANVILQPIAKIILPSNQYQLEVFTINGHRFSLSLVMR